MAATIGQKHKNGFKIVEIWDNHSESLKNNLYNDFKGPEHLLGGMNLENKIDSCQTTVLWDKTPVYLTHLGGLVGSSLLTVSKRTCFPPSLGAIPETQ